MSPRLPRMFWGEIIYATPGSGKTYLANKYKDVWDADDLIAEAIEEITNFDYSYHGDPDSISDKRVVINAYFRYINFNRRLMNRVYERAMYKMKEKCRNNDVVLLGTRDMMHKADRVFLQKNEGIVRTGFNSDAENDKAEDLPDRVPVHYISEYLDNSLHRVCKSS